MRRNLLFLICPFVFLALQENVWAQQIVVPAGTLLRCTLNEPNFSSATAEGPLIRRIRKSLLNRLLEMLSKELKLTILMSHFD